MALLRSDIYKRGDIPQIPEINILLDHLLRLIFLSQVRLYSQVETLLMTLLDSRDPEGQKLAVICLYCMALSI